MQPSVLRAKTLDIHLLQHQAFTAVYSSFYVCLKKVRCSFSIGQLQRSFQEKSAKSTLLFSLPTVCQMTQVYPI